MQNLLLSLYWTLSKLSLHVAAQVIVPVAPVFNGGPCFPPVCDPLVNGVGVVATSGLQGPVNRPLRDVILLLLAKALSFLALSAVIMIIAAGFYLVLSAGEDAAKDKAKKIILYVSIGLLIILFCRVLVSFFLIELPASLA